MSLNPSQRAAVEHEQGPLVVLAGAGSGKTRVIVQRIARLIERGTRPEAILAVTFTNKAAGEMRERVAGLIGKEVAERVGLSTFHSFGLRLLREEAAHVWGESHEAHTRFVIFDQGDSIGVVKEVLRELRRDKRLDPAAIQARISLWKNAFVAPDDVKETDVEYDAVARDVYPSYEARLRAMRAVDFDDLVVLPVRILRDHAEVRAKWRGRFRHLLVDEFQDTSRSQLELVKLLANELGNVCVVGDDDQSIYGWRGADVGNIREFPVHFPGAKVVALEDNYRSREAICAVANAAIARAPGRLHDKVLRAARGKGDAVRLVVVDDEPAEAKMVVREIRSLLATGKRPRDVAVLYRSAIKARLVEEELRASRIRYRLYGGTQLFDRKEVKDAAAYLRAVVHPRDEISLRRVLNYPARGIGETTVERIEKLGRGKGISFADAVRCIGEVRDVPDGAVRGATSLLSALEQARARFAEGTGLAAAARALFEHVGLRDAILEGEGGSPAAARRVGNLEFLLASLARYEESERSEKPSLHQFLARITLQNEQESDDPGNAVTLSTLHAAKGLEFPVVFVLGVNEGELPHSRTTDPKVTDATPADIEEERRLFYVGVTRAEDRLYLVRTRRRSMRGRVTPLAPSRFLEGLPPEQVTEHRDEAETPLSFEEIEKLGTELLARLAGPAKR